MVFAKSVQPLYLSEFQKIIPDTQKIPADIVPGFFLSTPSDYIDSKEYFSWERYFTALLIEKAAGTYLNYTKKTLNKAYLSDSTKNAILGQNFLRLNIFRCAIRVNSIERMITLFQCPILSRGSDSIHFFHTVWQGRQTLSGHDNIIVIRLLNRTVNLRHLMDFGKKPFTIKVLNTNQIVHSMEELILAAGEFV